MPALKEVAVRFVDGTEIICYPPDPTGPPVTPPTPPPGTPDITIYAGEPVFFRVPAEWLTGEAPIYYTFGWDFGDVTSGSRFNQINGFNAAHLFENQGDFTVTLTRTPTPSNSTGTVATKTWVVRALVDDRQTYYVSQSTGSDNNVGSLASPFATPNKALSVVRAHNEPAVIRFKRGDTWSIPRADMSIDASSVLLADYGSGAKPKMLNVAPVGASNTVFVLKQDRGVIRNIQFDTASVVDGDGRDTIARCVRCNGTNTAVVDCEVDHVDRLAYQEESRGKGLLALGNIALRDGRGVVDRFIWWSGVDLVALGNTCKNGIAESPIRANGQYHLIWGNTLHETNYGPALSAPLNTISKDMSKAAIAMQAGGLFWIEANTFGHNDPQSGIAIFGPLGKANGKEAERTRYVQVRNNTFVGTGTGMYIVHGSEYTRVEGNNLAGCVGARLGVGGVDNAWPQYRGRTTRTTILKNNTLASPGHLQVSGTAVDVRYE